MTKLKLGDSRGRSRSPATSEKELLAITVSYFHLLS